MITNHYYLKPTEHVRRSSAVSVSYILSLFLGTDCCARLKTRYCSGQSGSPYGKEKQQHHHKTVKQKSIVTAMNAKKQKKSLFKGSLNYWRQNTGCKPIPSLSFLFFIPFGPCSKDKQAGPRFHTTISDTFFPAQEELRDSLDGFEFEENHPESLFPLKQLNLTPLSPQPSATCIFRHSKLRWHSEQMMSLRERDCFWVIFSLVPLIGLFPLPATTRI